MIQQKVNNTRKHKGDKGLRWLPVMLSAVIAVMTVALQSCNTTGCTDNRSALPLMGFYFSTTGEPVALDSLEIGGVDAPDDSLLMKAGTSAIQLYVPFRFEKPSTSFYFHYAYKSQGLDDKEFNDTVTFHYTSLPYFASEECGAYYRYIVNRVEYTRHLIDSVAVVDSVFTNVEMERIKVFFRTAEERRGE